MKILQLCNKNPYPPLDGGAIAMLNISKSLANEGHNVVILSMNTRKHHVDADHIPENLTSRITFHYILVNTSIRPLSLLINLFFSTLPYHAIRFNKPQFRKALVSLLQNETFDIVQLEGLYLKSYLSLIRKYHQGTVAYRAHNIEHKIWYRLAGQMRNPLKKYYFHNLANRIERYEKDLLNRYDLLLPITDDDLDTFNNMGNSKPAQVIPTGVLADAFCETLSEKSRKSIFYIGALDWIPNQEGLVWFIDKVWPDLQKNHPSPDFHIAGRNAPAWLEKKCSENNIIFHGEINDAHRFIDENDIMIVPLFAGSGIRIKIIEAMARSKVVVTTSVGIQGIHIRDSKHALIANDVLSFRNAIESLQNNHSFFREVQKNAFSFARENFNNSIIIKMLINFYTRNIAC
jgi:glycosyltransferase involved in cell wall biosynthesis